MNELIATYGTNGISKVLSRIAKEEDEEGAGLDDSHALNMAVDLKSALESYAERYGKE